MEILAMEMKCRGMYIARHLSYKNIIFKVDKVVLTPTSIHMYNECVAFWVELLQSFQAAGIEPSKKKMSTMSAQFWSAHQIFFKYLVIAAKIPQLVQLSRNALISGKCVVIGLQSTGEARTLEQLKKGEIDDFVSTAKGVVKAFVENHLPAGAIKDRLLAQIELLSLPCNPIDQIINELGGPDYVSEMTGRKGRVVKDENGQVILF